MTEPKRALLPSPPSGVRMLTNDEVDTLRRLTKMTVTVANCITCRGKGWILWRDAAGQPTEYDCDCVGQYLMFQYLRYSGIPLAYQRLGWADYTNLSPSVVDQVGSFLANRQRYLDAGFGLLLYGTRGNGKTLLANLLLKEMAGAGTRVYSTTFSEMVDNFMETFSDKAHRRWFAQHVRNVPVLFIDDVGREYHSNAERAERATGPRVDNRPGAVRESMLESVVRHRVSNALPTIITTNLTPDEIAQGYGGHTVSLLSEKSIEVEVIGKDSRREMKSREEEYLLAGMTRPIVIDSLGGA